MKQLKELTIVTPNKPGKLAAILAALAKAKLNIEALDSSSGYDLNMVRLITDNTTKTKALLEKLGHNVAETGVLAVNIADKPGHLVKIARALGKAGVNIDYMYATAPAAAPVATVILHPSDIVKAERVLADAELH